MIPFEPSRGEIWLVDLAQTREHGQSGKRPCLIISVDLFNHGPAGLVIALPITTKARGIPFHVGVHPPEAGLKKPSFVKCEDVRSISKERLSHCLGAVSLETLQSVNDRLRILLEL